MVVVVVVVGVVVLVVVVVEVMLPLVDAGAGEVVGVVDGPVVTVVTGDEVGVGSDDGGAVDAGADVAAAVVEVSDWACAGTSTTSNAAPTIPEIQKRLVGANRGSRRASPPLRVEAGLRTGLRRVDMASESLRRLGKQMGVRTALVPGTMPEQSLPGWVLCTDVIG